MSFRGLHHVGFTVSDLDRSIAFYHDVLGLELVQEPSPVFDDPSLGEKVGVPGAALRQISFRLGDATIELLEYAKPPSPVERPVPNNAIGAGHIGFLVDDIHAKKAELEARGIEFLSDVNVVDEGVLAGWRWCYFLDPDGISLELVEVAYTRPEERAAAIAEYLASRGR